MAAFDGAQQVIGLFARSPRAAGADSQRLVKPGAFDRGAPQEDRKRDCATPYIPTSNRSGPPVPPSAAGKTRGHNFASRNPAPTRILAKEALHALQQVRGVPAIVVRKGDDVTCSTVKTGVDGARVPGG